MNAVASLAGAGAVVPVLAGCSTPTADGPVADVGSAQAADDGELEHSGVVNFFGPGDRATVLHSGGTTVGQHTSDLRRLLTEGS